MPIYIAVSSPEPALNRVFLPQSPFCGNISRHDEERSIHIALRPNMKTAEDGARERADTVPVLDCQSCGALTPGERFRYFADQIICEACDERNPQSRRRMVPRGASPAPRHLRELRQQQGPRRAGHGGRLPDHARPSVTYPERRDDTPTARLSRRYARAARRLRQQPPAMGSGHCPDHTSAVPQEPAQDRLSAALN